MAYVRKKKINGSEYYYLVEGHRGEDGKVRQRVIRYLGKHDSIEAARLAVADVVPKEEEKRYWITVPWRQGYTENLKPMFPVFLSKEAAQEYGGPGFRPGGPKIEYEVLGFDGPELAAELRGARLGANHIVIWGAGYKKYNHRQEPEEILTRRAFVKRLELEAG